MSFHFDYKVDRSDEQTIITVTECNFQRATVLLSKCLKKFGNWSSNTQVKLWGNDRMQNREDRKSVV